MIVAWGDRPMLKCMCLFDTPLYIYYSHIAVFALCLLTAILIFLKNPKEASNRNAFYFILIIAFWVANVFGQWTIHNVELNIFFVRISIILVDLIFLFFLYFSYHFTHTKIDLGKKLVLALPCVALSFLAFSGYAFEVFNVDDCYYAQGKLISFYTYFLEIFYVILSTRLLIRYYKKPDLYFLIKHQTRILIGAIWFFVLWNIIFGEIDRISFFSDSYIESTPHFIIGIFFFVSLIAFAIIKRELFEFDTVLTKTFTLFLWSLIFLGMLLFHMSVGITVMFVSFYIALMYIFWKM